MKRFENLEKAMCKELEKLDKKYAGDVAEMTTQDAEKADLLYHAMKSAETYYAMVGEDYDDHDDRSYRRGRDAMGRYVSRDMGYSGHYPGWTPPYYR